MLAAPPPSLPVAANASSTSHLEVRPAATLREFEDAFRTAYEVYRPLGFTAFSTYGLRVSPAQLRPTTLVLIAYAGPRPVGTLSLYEDGMDGLPLDRMWPEETRSLRQRRTRLIEVGTLMVRHSTPDGAGLSACSELFRAAWLYGRRLRLADTFCASVQDRHEWFYRRLMGFVPYGPCKMLSWHDGPSIPAAVPLWMDLDHAEDAFRRRFGSLGASRRNLHRWFVEDDIAARERRLRAALELRRALDRREFLDRFAPLCKGERP